MIAELLRQEQFDSFQPFCRPSFRISRDCHFTAWGIQHQSE